MTCSSSSCSTRCLTPQEMCFIVKGDKLVFLYKLSASDGTPIPLYGSTMTFWMKLDVNSPDGEPGDLIDTHVFPDTVDSSNGIGSQEISTTQTEALIACKTYNYRFIISSDPDNIYTIGLGLVQVIE